MWIKSVDMTRLIDFEIDSLGLDGVLQDRGRVLQDRGKSVTG